MYAHCTKFKCGHSEKSVSFSGLMERFNVSVGVVIAQMRAFAKAHRTEPLTM